MVVMGVIFNFRVIMPPINEPRATDITELTAGTGGHNCDIICVTGVARGVARLNTSIRTTTQWGPTEEGGCVGVKYEMSVSRILGTIHQWSSKLWFVLHVRAMHGDWICGKTAFELFFYFTYIRTVLNGLCLWLSFSPSLNFSLFFDEI